MAGSISFSGASSGIDSKAIIAQLMAVKRLPLDRLNAKKSTYQQGLTVLSDLRSKLSALGAAAAALNSLREFKQFSAASTDANNEHFSVTVSSSAQAATHSVQVTKLARAETEVSQGFAATTSTIATGDLKVRVAGGEWQTVAITGSNNTLEGVRDAINAKGLDLTAAIMNVGGSSPYALLLTGKSTGDAQTIEIDTSGLSGPDPVPTFTQSQAAQSAEVVFDGVTVTSATNKFEGIISGVTLQAKKVDLTSTYSVAVASNIAGIKEDIDTFVAKYNDVMSYLSTKTSATATDRDPALEQIRSQLRNALTESVASGGAYRTLAQIGVTADRSGTLSVDDDKLTDALTDHFDDVAKLISAYGEGDNAYLRFSSSGSKTQDGTYAVNITGLGAGFGGTIGGYAAIGAAGGLLTGAKGTPVEGLAIVYTGSSTGDVGNVSFHAGVFEKFDRLIDGYLSYSDGLLKTRENSINRQIRYLNDQISMKEQQLDKVETRLNAQFAKMEVALSQLQTQNAFLTANSAASS